MSIFPLFDDTVFQWRPSSADPAKYTRKLGAEHMVNCMALYNHGELITFVGLTVESYIPLPDTATLRTYVRAAWAHTRRTVPTLAAGLEQDATGMLNLVYRVPTPTDADAWLGRTVHVTEDDMPLDALRTTLSSTPAPNAHGDMTWLHVLRRPGTDTFGLLFHSSHVPFDGTGAKAVVNRVLRHLALLLAGDTTCEGEDAPAQSGREWGAEVGQLLPSASQILNESEVRQGDPLYDQTLSELLATMRDMVKVGVPSFSCSNPCLSIRPSGRMQNNHGVKHRSLGPGNTVRLEHVFAPIESEAIITSFKEKRWSPNQAG